MSAPSGGVRKGHGRERSSVGPAKGKPRGETNMQLRLRTSQTKRKRTEKSSWGGQLVECTPGRRRKKGGWGGHDAIARQSSIFGDERKKEKDGRQTAVTRKEKKVKERSGVDKTLKWGSFLSLKNNNGGKG